LAAIGGESNVGVNVGDQPFGSATQQRSTIKILQVLATALGTHKKQIIPVGRKAQTSVMDQRWGHDLGIAVCGNIAQVERLQSSLTDHVEDVLAVGRNGSESSFPGFRNLADRDVLEWCGMTAVEKGVNAVAGSSDQSEIK